MKKYYVCRDFSDSCGISKYGLNFYNNILKPRGYELIHLQEGFDCLSLLEAIDNSDTIWFEIGLGSTRELNFFKKIVKKGNKNTIVTIHDAPFLEYPIIKSNFYLLNVFFKILQIIFLRKPFDFFYNYLSRTKYIFTLNPKGKLLLEQRFKLKNVISIKHILTDTALPSDKMQAYPEILYFGFIGKNKGLEYALELHKAINLKTKNIFFMKVIGKGIDLKSKEYLESLKKIYIDNVEYLGYLGDLELDRLMCRDNIVFLPTKDYRFICPTSGSVLNSMNKLNTVFTNDVNSNGFIIQDKKTGFFLTGDLDQDVNAVLRVLSDPEIRKKISENIYVDFQENYSTLSVNNEISKYEI